MKRLMTIMAVLSVTMSLVADTCKVDNYTYTYGLSTINSNTTAYIYGYYNGGGVMYSLVDPKPTNSIALPSYLPYVEPNPEKHGFPVAGIERCAFYDCKAITEVSMPNTVSYISAYAFHECVGITNIIFSSNLRFIGHRAFYGCTGLSSISLPDSLDELGTSAAFAYCTSLKKVRLPPNLLSIGQSTFWQCHNLQDIELPDRITVLQEGALQGCFSLTNVVLSAALRNIEYRALCGCNFKSIRLPPMLTTIGDEVFYDCPSLTNIVIPASVTFVGDRAFRRCKALKTASLSPNMTAVSSGLFNECTNLMHIEIPSGITHIGNAAFAGCTNLSKLVIPDSVTSIGDDAFYGCNGLSCVIFRGNAPTIGSRIFYSVKNGCTVYVRKNSIGWGVDIPGTWNGLNIQYLTPKMEIAVANNTGEGVVEVDGEFSNVEVASGVTLIVRGENLDIDALTAKIIPKSYEEGQSATLFKVAYAPVFGGVSFSVVLDEDSVDPDLTAAEIVATANAAAFGSAASGDSVYIDLLTAKQGLYYGIAVANDLVALEDAAADVSLVRAGEGGVTIPVVKPIGDAVFFKVIISDRLR